ncbi:MAG: imidazole glycerol phosphate synthase subunit HisF [Fimbriimonadaceae bacterium]|nr:imidazole glycerol phosphate synthase subunit HisF [Fimbriimonadaceae bacterium]
MNRIRLIPCLDIRDGRVVKGTNFIGIRDAGDPVELAKRYEDQGADELVFLDITASHEGRAPVIELARRVSEVLFVPFTVGGGLREVSQVREALLAGADKVSLNTAAVARPELITESADIYGAQCVVVAIDARMIAPGKWEVTTHGGRSPTGLDAVEWAKRAVTLGAGEILLTSMDGDGTRSGYDLALTKAVSHAVNVPVIASGGAGNAGHMVDAVEQGGAAAVLLAGILHDGLTTVSELKTEMHDLGVVVR